MGTVAVHNARLSVRNKDFSPMNDPAPRFVAEKTSWRALAPWIPSLLVPIVLALVLVAYVVYQAAS